MPGLSERVDVGIAPNYLKYEVIVGRFCDAIWINWRIGAMQTVSSDTTNVIIRNEGEFHQANVQITSSSRVRLRILGYVAYARGVSYG